ncbi:protein kinase C theta type-like [Leptodactylus fuscus]|uniref:protein kinase C theta type-like n=1 Tax=Leptodactylus fuscus TaxID=238119 RepID=UPI003F4EC32B
MKPSQVFLASLPGRNTFMAVKVVTRTEYNAAVIMRERQMLLKVRDCPFICQLNAAHQSQDNAYFIMEYLSGGSLEELITMCGRLNTDTVRFYTAEIACGLHFLHTRNIVHRDIKPSNIMLDGNGHICIIDLGIARERATSSTKIHGTAGTPSHQDPEVQEFHAAIDWWRLGIVMSRMSTGFHPFHYGGNFTRNEPKLPSRLDADLEDLLLNLLQVNSKMLDVYSNIRNHPFFNIICWEDLEKKRARPPFIPFKAIPKNENLPWPENQTLHPEDEFNYMSPSWTRTMPLLLRDLGCRKHPLQPSEDCEVTTKSLPTP